MIPRRRVEDIQARVEKIMTQEGGREYGKEMERGNGTYDR
jgi:hypothetical protein